MPYVDKLHTNSEYAPDSKNLVSMHRNQDELLIKAYGMFLQLQEKEQEFYRRFGYDSADEFYKGIKAIMSKAETDLRILQNFSSGNLRKTLQKFGKNLSSRLSGQDVVLSLRMENQNAEAAIEKIQQELLEIKGSNQSIQYEVVGANINIALTWDTITVKKVISSVQTKKFQTKGKGADSAKGLLKYIQNQAGDLVKVYKGNNPKNPTVEFPLRSGPFNYGVDEIRNSSDMQLLKIRTEMLNFIYQDLNVNQGSKDFTDAVKTVLNQTIGENVFSKSIEFFAGGSDSWIDNIVGAMGEFQAAIFFNYIAKQCPNKNLANEITEIIGNSTANAYKQMPHSDLQILEAFGIQVKNYSHAGFGSYERTIDVHLHPMEIAPLMSDSDLVSYVINSFFNQSITPISEEEWKDFFEQNAMELLNLDIPTNLAIPSKVSFYLIGGHLIPGSEIIYRGFSRQVKQDQIIKVSQTSLSVGRAGLDDWEYLMGDPPKFLDWWKGNKYIDWEPTSNNSLTTWDKYISIRTKFTFKPFWDSEAFKLF